LVEDDATFGVSTGSRWSIVGCQKSISNPEFAVTADSSRASLGLDG
jgi:hypothetical protein